MGLRAVAALLAVAAGLGQQAALEAETHRVTLAGLKDEASHRPAGCRAPCVEYPVCIKHTADREQNYYHLFERNLNHLIGPMRMHKGQGGLIQLEQATNPTMLKEWISALRPGVGKWDVATGNTNPKGGGFQCGEVVETRWRNLQAVNEIREVAYGIKGLDLLTGLPAGSSLAERGAKPLLCFLSRTTGSTTGFKTPSLRGRTILNAAELRAAAEARGYEVRDLTFEKTALSDPLDQAAAVAPCNVAIGIHGAQMSNLMFMHPGGKSMQVVPFGISDHYGVEYQLIASMSGLKHTDWSPKSNADVEIHWDAMLTEERVRDTVCDYGVDNLFQHGTSQYTDDSKRDFLNWGFYINQDVRVDPAAVEALLGAENAAHYAPPLLFGAGSFVEAASEKTTKTEQQAAAELLAAHGARVLELLDKMDVDAARKYCQEHALGSA